MDNPSENVIFAIFGTTMYVTKRAHDPSVIGFYDS